MRRLLAFAVAAVLLAAIAVHLAPNLDEVRQLGQLSAGVLAGAVVLLLGSHLAHNESILVPLRSSTGPTPTVSSLILTTIAAVMRCSVTTQSSETVRIAARGWLASAASGTASAARPPSP